MNGSFHDEQDRLLREAGRDHLAGADLPAEAADRLRAELGHGFARRRMRRRRWTVGVAAVFMLGVTLVGFQTDVISEMLDIVFKRINRLGKPTFESISTGDRYGSHLDSTATIEEQRALVEKAHKARMAGEWTVSRVDGYTLRGEMFFYVKYDFEVDDAPYSYYVAWPDEDHDRWAENLIASHEDGPMAEMTDDIRAGTAQELTPETVSIFDIPYVFDKYTASYPDWGEIVVGIARLPEGD